VLEMASGKIPWSEHDFDNPVAAICKIGLEDEIPLVPTNLSADLQHFIKECLQRDPSKRPTAE
jgi:serine/threonine protein kinase